MALHKIAARSEVRSARSYLRQRESATVEEQIRIASIASPTGAEGERGEYVRAAFERAGLSGVRVDEVGNVIGVFPGTDPKAEPVVIASHLDSIFAVDTELRLYRAGDRIHLPGITDNARGLAAIVALIEAMGASGVRTRRPLCWVGTVGEEGLGDLRGVKHLFREDGGLRRVASFIAVDGAGMTRVINRAIGARRLRAVISGGGGHSWGDRGAGNPIHAIGDAIARLRALQVGGAETAVTVARAGGGTSINAIPGEAWIELDLRSDDPRALDTLWSESRTALERALEKEAAAARSGGPLALHLREIGNRPSGTTPDDDPLVRLAVAATRLVGAEAELVGSSTDANVPIALGIPAIAIGAGGIAGGVHTTSEWYENEDGFLGLERALLVIVGAAELDTPRQPLSTTE